MKTYTKRGERGGYEITITNNGNIKLETWSAYVDEPDMIYYIRPDKDNNADTDWGKVVNEYGTTNADILVHNVHTLQYHDNVFRMKTS